MSTALPAQLSHELLRVFADPLRLEIVRLLAREQLCTCHIVDATGAKQPTVSHHLKVLREAGMVETEPVGSFTFYRLRPDPLAAVASGFEALAASAADAPRNRIPCD